MVVNRLQLACFALTVALFPHGSYSQPANDLCGSAVPMVVNGPVVTGSSFNATTERICRSGSNNVRAIWFTFEGTGNMMTVSSCHAETSFPTRVNILNTCGNSACVADVTSTSGVEPLPSCSNPNGALRTFQSVAGQNYVVAVDGTSIGLTGDVGLNVIDFVAPNNDVCTKAGPLVVNEPAFTRGTNINATTDRICRAGGDNVRGVWYLLIGNGRTLTISTCAAWTDFPTNVYLQAACGNQRCDATSVPDGSCGSSLFASTLQWESLVNTRYYILVQGETAQVTGSFGIRVTDDTFVEPEPVPPTVSPVSSPTASPTSLSEAETVPPTFSPVSSPTASPTSLPTKSPTAEDAPTEQPLGEVDFVPTSTPAADLTSRGSPLKNVAWSALGLGLVTSSLVAFG